MLDSVTKTLASGKNFAVFTTLLPNGHPQAQVMWVDADDDYVYVNTEVHRTKYRNVQRDQRVTVTIVDAENPYHFVEVRGRVVGETHGDEARAHLDRLAVKYRGKPHDPPTTAERVTLQIAPDREVVH